MTRSRITDEDATALLDGGVLAGGEEVRALTEAIARIRAASRDTVARPSDELLLLLRPDAAWEPVDASGGIDDRAGTWGPARRKAMRMFGWFAGLGLGVKLLLLGGAAAATVVGAATLTAPPPDMPAPVASATSDSSESLEPTAEPTEEPSGEPSGEPTALPGGVPTFEPCATPFGEQVAPVAQDKPGTGREFGEGVSSAAREKGDCAEGEDGDAQDAPGSESGDDSGSSEHGGRSEHAPESTHSPSDRAPENRGGGSGNGRGR
ncbi:MAG: hypothetical protein ACTHMQ_00895 [Protaetiibacter sp.]